MSGPKKVAAIDMAREFFGSLGIDEKLTDVERILIEKHGIDENKYRWEARYLSALAIDFALASLKGTKHERQATAVRRAYGQLCTGYAAQNKESSEIYGQFRHRAQKYAPAIDKDNSHPQSVALALPTEFAHQFDPITNEMLPLLLTAGTAIFRSTVDTIVEMMETHDVQV